MLKLTKEQFIEKSNIIHGNKYCYSKVNYTLSNKKVLIMCDEHGDFHQEANSHLRGSGCPSCSGKSKLSNDIFIERSNLIHNNKYDYSLVEYKNAFSKVIIICRYHGEFKQTPNNHLNNHGCPLCGINESNNKNSNDVQDFILNSKKKHGSKYDYSLVKYKNRKTNVIIICKIHGEFKKIPYNHVNGQGCPKCSKYNYKLKKTKTRDEFISDAIRVHGDEYYDYSLVEYTGTDNKVKIICRKHGTFEQKCYKHLQGQGCPTCSLSRLEKEVGNFLNKNNIKYSQQYGRKNDSFYLNGQLLDFYLPDFKCAIECQGDQHFKPVDFGNKGEKFAYERYMKTISNDLSKYSKCRENGIRILYYCGQKSYYDGYEYIDIVYDNLEKLISNL
jgi:Zn finger protein HypA/HybF involved in hydrogenase expression